MGIDKVNQRYFSDKLQPNVTTQPAQNNEEQTVIGGSASPATDTVKITKPIPEWAKIEKSDGKIGDFKQGNTGDCWLLSTLYALKLAGCENQFITPRIKKENGNIMVSFGSGKEKKEFSFNQQEINERRNNPPEKRIEYVVPEGGQQIRDIIEKHNNKRFTTVTAKKIVALNSLVEKDIPKLPAGRTIQVPYIFGELSNGDIDVVAFEMAQEKFLGKEMVADYPSFAMKNLTGRQVTSIKMSSGEASTGHEKAPKDEAKASWLLFDYVLNNKPKVAVIACTGKNVNKNTGLVGPHAYAVDLAQSNKEQVVLVNPHDTTKRKIMERKDFKNNFSYIVMADLNDYKTYTVKSGDNLSKIASLNGVIAQDLMLANPALKDINNIQIGQKLNIPVIK